MISDVLHDARMEIEQYLLDEHYSDPKLREEIESVLSAMKALQQKLDAPPVNRRPSLREGSGGEGDKGTAPR